MPPPAPVSLAPTLSHNDSIDKEGSDIDVDNSSQPTIPDDPYPNSETYSFDSVARHNMDT